MVSIIILSYNTKDLLKSCLESIFLSLNKKSSFEVVVVDNASLDGSAGMIQKEFQDVILVENKENKGFAGGVNSGVKKANGDIILLLNSDAQLQEGSIEEVVRVMNSDANIGVAGGVLERKDGSLEKSFGDFFTPWRVINSVILGNNKTVNLKKNKIIEVDWIQGACMFIKKEVFQKIHGFDENFFMYVEDMDFCYRAKKIGYKSVVIPSFKIVHYGQGSSNKTFAIINIYKGILLFFKKHKNSVEYSIVKLILIVKAILSILIGFITGNKYLTSTYTKALQTAL